MKTLTISTLFILSSFISPAILQAQKIEENTTETVQQLENTEKRMSAFSLVSAAYRGRFEDWDIPSYATLNQAYRGGKVTATDLVEAAIEADELSQMALEDEDYVNAVESELDVLEQ